MRKFSAILLISLFAFSQYARQINYLECKFSNTFKPDSSKCDCEKLVGFDKQESNETPVSKTHTHTHLDELFSTAKEIVIACYYQNLQSTSNYLAGDECEGKYSKPWQPPNNGQTYCFVSV